MADKCCTNNKSVGGAIGGGGTTSLGRGDSQARHLATEYSQNRSHTGHCQPPRGFPENPRGQLDDMVNLCFKKSCRSTLIGKLLLSMTIVVVVWYSSKVQTHRGNAVSDVFRFRLYRTLMADVCGNPRCLAIQLAGAAKITLLCLETTL